MAEPFANRNASGDALNALTITGDAIPGPLRQFPAKEVDEKARLATTMVTAPTAVVRYLSAILRNLLYSKPHRQN
ncbi:hypothetical protein FHX08_006142 [Rhizobium sp. BK529]|uniref:hypothetical protein n=1 Tax=unclassified Rhizobium TaxID=2613769 RepID=UPI00104D8C7B|nr:MULTISPECIES: hypothetical protein [unclassified Rhizobium]MBB3595725.1 hypothetical protein [Rhizobium sp. BK529]